MVPRQCSASTPGACGVWHVQRMEGGRCACGGVFVKGKAMYSVGGKGKEDVT